MKAFNGFKSEASSTKVPPLPVGTYVAKIKAVKIDGLEPDQRMIIRVDVCEGPFTDYFLTQYKRAKESSKYEPKYKGDYKIRIPNEANTKSQYPESDIRRFNDMIYRIEQSNSGYHWDWNENGLVGLLVGINMVEDEYNGYKFTKIGRLEIADDVRKGIVQPAKKKDQQGDADDSQYVDKGFTAVETDELPF